MWYLGEVCVNTNFRSISFTFANLFLGLILKSDLSMSKKRILFIATEMSPYLELTEFAGMVNRLAIKSNDTGFEVRCIMPRFGVINERRHKLHEVVRLSGINVSVDNDDYPLQIKVASLPNARLQVYFLENEDFFKRKQIFHDENEEWFDDNGLRTIFFCKGALETVKKFGWAPDVVHCSGWMSSLVPAYIKTAYKREPVFGNSKIVFTIAENTFEEKLSSDFVKKALINANIKEKDLDTAKELDNTALYRVGATHADAITFGSEDVNPKLITEFGKAKGKKIVSFKGLDTDLSEYIDLYESLSI